jgi:hypothetical protein
MEHCAYCKINLRFPGGKRDYINGMKYLTKRKNPKSSREISLLCKGFAPGFKLFEIYAYKSKS